MTAANLINLAEKAGILLTLEAGQLVADAPDGALTAELLETLRTHKADLLRLLAGSSDGDAITLPDCSDERHRVWQVTLPDGTTVTMINRNGLTYSEALHQTQWRWPGCKVEALR